MALCGESLEYEELVLIAQGAEHRAGTPCGTMDQSASISGGMIRFDGSNHSATQLNPDLEGHAFLVIDSGVKRSLSHSSYPHRVEECRRALEQINSVSAQQFPNLASISEEEFADLGSSLDPTLRQRVRHVVSEVERVRQGEAALADKDWKRFGSLMTESGRSSALDYEISHEVVESIVDLLIQTPGVLGARMMGGGEGGSLIALIAPVDQEEILRQAEALANTSGAPGAGANPVYRFNFASGARSGNVTGLLSR
jgi:galactokinase